MRYVYMTLIIVLTAIIVIFMLQNLRLTTVSFFAVSLTMPLALLIFLVYVLGMFTGGFTVSLLRTWFHGAAKKT